MIDFQEKRGRKYKRFPKPRSAANPANKAMWLQGEQYLKELLPIQVTPRFCANRSGASPRMRKGCNGALAVLLIKCTRNNERKA